MTNEKIYMSKEEAEDYVRSCGEYDGPGGDINLLGELFFAIYELELDELEESNQHIWSLICAGVEDLPGDLPEEAE